MKLEIVTTTSILVIVLVFSFQIDGNYCNQNFNVMKKKTNPSDFEPIDLENVGMSRIILTKDNPERIKFIENQLKSNLGKSLKSFNRIVEKFDMTFRVASQKAVKVAKDTKLIK
jgi:hypothetical protein